MDVRDLLKYKLESFKDDVNNKDYWWNTMSKGKKIELDDRTIYQLIFLLDMYCSLLDEPSDYDFKDYKGYYSSNYVYPLLLDAYKTIEDSVGYKEDDDE